MDEIEVVDSNRKGMRYKKGDTSIHLSSEITQQICVEMAELGTQFISGAVGMTRDYFDTQLKMYYGQLSAYINKQNNDSEERKMVLNYIISLNERYVSEIAMVYDVSEQEEMRKRYKELIEDNKKFYMEMLDKHNDGNKMPDKPNILKGIGHIFTRK